MLRRFRGESVHKVDQKGRVSVPAPFRRVLEEGDPDWTEGLNPNFVLIYGMPSGNCLEGYTIEGAARLDEKVSRLGSFSKERRALERLLNTQSIYAQVDENGRIVLPQRLREMFGLDEEALFAGMGEHFQIWAPRAYRRGHGGHRRLAGRARPGRRSLRAPRRHGPREPVMMMAPIAPHVPVLLAPILRAVAPVAGTWLDGTFGAGGYARALLDAGAARVIGVDRDPEALERAAAWAGAFGERLTLVRGPLRRARPDRGRGGGGRARRGRPRHRRLVDAARPGGARLLVPEGRAARHAHEPGGSHRPPTWSTALPEATLADILFQLGEERASRRIARAIVADRKAAPFETTLQLAGLIERLLPRPKPGQPHPATRSFQALRIAVNDELGELARGLAAAEAALRPGGWLAVVTFHSLEDRIVKRFLQLRSGAAPQASRHAPEARGEAARFRLVTRKAVVPDAAEIAVNPRARSAKLRLARRLDAPAGTVDPRALGLPKLALEGLA